MSTLEAAPAAPAAPTARVKPELLSPAGDEACIRAAVENGADAVYLGVSEGWNARARATNFGVDALPEIMAGLHRRGVRGYVALNTLVFSRELPAAGEVVRRVADAGVDAVIVQDLGLAGLIREIRPELEVHASTQMSVTSIEGARLAREVGASRVILARELSVAEVARVAAESPIPTEVFVHGALCVAYSGQCLTSEALGGRSANRGECAQACRMPYEILRDGLPVDLGDVRYLLSPRDLAAFDLIPELVAAGVASLKIEGRLKAPEYVASITRQYRGAIDAAWSDRPSPIGPEDIREMEMSFSRGFSHGFLDGTNHKALVRGDYAKKRGVFLGRVAAIGFDFVRVAIDAPIKPGDGVVFDGSESEGVDEQGGRVYEVREPRRSGRRDSAANAVELSFGRRDLDLRRLRVGQRAWKTDDPELTRRLRSTFEGPPRRLVDLDLTVRASVGSPLSIEGRTGAGRSARVESDAPLVAADRIAADAGAIRDQLDRLGGTIYRLRSLDAEILGGPLVPKSLLNALRRDLVARLDREPTAPIAAPPPAIEPAGTPPPRPSDLGPPRLSALCRRTDQIEPAIAAGVGTIYLDYQDIKAYRDAVSLVRRASPTAEVYVATPRIQKPGEGAIFSFLARRGADGLVVRNAGGLQFCRESGTPFVADFSMNAANERTVDFLARSGARRVTASYDLSVDQLDDLIGVADPATLEVVIHQRMPMFHMEHCVFCAFLSPGTDATNCGRPCDRMDVTLRDRVGTAHPLKADVGCRNTLYNAVPQTAAESLPRLIARGARNLRVEFLDDAPDEVARVLTLYADAVAGRRDPRSLWRDLKATSRYGVTRGALAVIQ